MKIPARVAFSALLFGGLLAPRVATAQTEFDRARWEAIKRQMNARSYADVLKRKRFSEAIRIAASPTLDVNERDDEAVSGVLDSETATQVFNCLLTTMNGWNDDGGRQYVGAILRRRISLVNRFCGLTDEQREKIRLAGERDIARLFERIAEARRRFVSATTVTFDETSLADAVGDVPRVQGPLSLGPFDEDSFFAKIMRVSLTPAQRSKYDRWRSRSSPAARRELPDLSD